MSHLLEINRAYWNRRAESFSRGLFDPEEIDMWQPVLDRELPEDRTARILDIGTGPGFFCILAARMGYDVTAVDYSEDMLAKAMENAGDLKEKIRFLRMDAQHLTFEDNTFDVILTRNLTWNLEDPEQAYREWRRVLRPGGILLNFDAGWYEYLFDEEKATAYQEDRENVRKAGIRDGASYVEAPLMEDISRELYFSRMHRPGEDCRLLLKTGYSSFFVDTEIWKETLTPDDQINFGSTPGFMIRAKK